MTSYGFWRPNTAAPFHSGRWRNNARLVRIPFLVGGFWARKATAGFNPATLRALSNRCCRAEYGGGVALPLRVGGVEKLRSGGGGARTPPPPPRRGSGGPPAPPAVAG